MHTISKEFHFSASHQLNCLPDDHPCARIHGHNYVIKVELSAEKLDTTGFVVDYRKLDTFKKYLDDVLDHRHLNDIIPKNPTAENIGEFLYYKFKNLIPQLTAVEVSETPKTNARFTVPSNANSPVVIDGRTLGNNIIGEDVVRTINKSKEK